MAAIWGMIDTMRILCTRELQVSIRESMHAELRNAIASEPWLAAHYDITENTIRGKNGTEFIFRGLRHNMSSIKSMAQIDLCLVEEAEDVPAQSWLDLEPTIRTPGSEIWAIWNPKRDGSPIDKLLRKRLPPRAQVVQMNYSDNPWFPTVLEEQRAHHRAVLDPNTYAHIWEGAYLENSDSQIFADRFSVEEFAPGTDWDGPYIGLDFGFAADPTAAVKVWVHNNCLWIEQEAGRNKLELDETGAFVADRIPDAATNVIRADSARPESISYLKRNGLPKIQSCEKWAGSVEDGIAHIKSYRKVIIHPQCKETINEFRLYSYKVDRLTGDIKPDIVDAFNHYIDAIRYAIGPLVRKKSGFYIGFA